MKKINFIIILFLFVSSITTFLYVGVLKELMVKTQTYTGIDSVTLDDVLAVSLATFVWALLPSWLLAYAYRKICANGWWVVFIALVYSMVWISISFVLVGDYISHYGVTWLDSEILSFTVSREYFNLLYGLSFIPLIILGIYNKTEQDNTQ